jgi:hypothetical protein
MPHSAQCEIGRSDKTAVAASCGALEENNSSGLARGRRACLNTSFFDGENDSFDRNSSPVVTSVEHAQHVKEEDNQ